ncbi:MAG TPA: FecR family protein, partial [Verrucomicrobiae bacterium]|nr:FecR family protein [Verrucomicrobiae bacterium]
MKSSALTLSLAVSILPLFSSHAALDLKQSKFTQVVNDVQVIGSDQNATPAAVDGIFKVPDILRTGPNSRAELTADDQTITRVGANTVFSFDPANRTIDLQKGSVLFHSPKGRGGGTVQTGSATASVLGTTIVVSTTPDGGFKVLVLEGQAEVKFLSGLTQHLSPGQMTFILPGGGTSPVIVFRLDEQTKGSKLVNGFNHPLDSLGKINDEINNQLKQINKDKLKDTGLEVGDSATSSSVSTVDPSVLQSYFSSLTKFKPLFNGRGYFTIDGLFIATDNEEELPTDALFPALALSVNV